VRKLHVVVLPSGSLSFPQGTQVKSRTKYSKPLIRVSPKPAVVLSQLWSSDYPLHLLNIHQKKTIPKQPAGVRTIVATSIMGIAPATDIVLLILKVARGQHSFSLTPTYRKGPPIILVGLSRLTSGDVQNNTGGMNCETSPSKTRLSGKLGSIYYFFIWIPLALLNRRYIW
jgi:hypothetical protein